MPAIETRRIDRLVLDTNVLVRALLSPTGPAATLFSLSVRSKTLIVCAESLSELRRTFAYEHIASRAKPGVVDEIIDLLLRTGETIELTGKRGMVPDDPDDDKFIELAEAGNSDCLVTADGDLLSLRPAGDAVATMWHEVMYTGEIREFAIMRPSELLKAIELGEAI